MVWTMSFGKTSQKVGKFPFETLEKANAPTGGATIGRIVRG